MLHRPDFDLQFYFVLLLKELLQILKRTFNSLRSCYQMDFDEFTAILYNNLTKHFEIGYLNGQKDC